MDRAGKNHRCREDLCGVAVLRQQREGVAAIRRAGGVVTYDYERTASGRMKGP